MRTFCLRVEKVQGFVLGKPEVILSGPDGPMRLEVADTRPFRVGAAVTISVDDTPTGDVLTDNWPDGGSDR
jgi:hypothetical protein